MPQTAVELDSRVSTLVKVGRFGRTPAAIYPRESENTTGAFFFFRFFCFCFLTFLLLQKTHTHTHTLNPSSVSPKSWVQR